MSFAQKWKNYQRLTEAKEQSQLTSPFQQKMKVQRRRNGKMYQQGGNTKPPFGTSSLRFEGLKEKVDQQALNSFEVNDTLEPQVWEGEKLTTEVR